MKVIRKKPSSIDTKAKQRAIWIVGHYMTLTLGALYVLYAFKHNLGIYHRRSWKTLFLLAKRNVYSVTWKNSTWRQYLISWLPSLCYQGSLLGVFMSHGVTEYQKWINTSPSFYDLLSSENFQVILLAGLWVVSRRSSFKLFPLMIVSYLHITKKNAVKDTEISEITMKNAKLLHLMAYSELIVILTLLVNTFIFKEAIAGFVLLFTIAIFWLRVNFSPYTQATLLRLLMAVDKKIPQKNKEKWNVIKSFIFNKMKEREKALNSARAAT
ncbi:unnamed protein product [Kluyveromyces dobzhanskii CBS 2104]|uniref:WGS project CCBQ000000000 data, contig 00016 n=1 Tax=Kluyveromyces dobzhanskii CBS 2104 TaxID=1427455 RepID=A0A0A8L278_9SACH|nr:unnamed protein product [Kluyveromyces dobzhanskii CBS 2104]